jgi:uncharacterized damage-inducible protein DinB
MKFKLDQTIAILTRTPSTLQIMLDGLPDVWVHCNEGAETWSPYDIVGHFIHGERTDWIPRAKIILKHGPSKQFDPFDRYAQFEASKGKTLKELLDLFETLRRRNLEVLSDLNLSPADIELVGIHPEFGEVTLGQLLATWAVHDLSHIGQIAQVMAKQYANAVGPWQAYLPILRV